MILGYASISVAVIVSYITVSLIKQGPNRHGRSHKKFAKMILPIIHLQQLRLLKSNVLLRLDALRFILCLYIAILYIKF